MSVEPPAPAESVTVAPETRSRGSVLDHALRVRYGWLLFLAILALQAAMFVQRANTEVVWAYPTAFDQAAYLTQAYGTFEDMTKEGVARGVLDTLAVPLPTGKFYPIEAALLFLFTGPNRLGALTLNFFFLALLEIFLLYTVTWLFQDWAVGFVALGLLLATCSRFQAAGGLMDFRIDFSASCLFGIFVCAVVRSGFFESRRWSAVAGLAAAILVGNRFLTALYIASLVAVLLGYFAFLWWRSKNNGAIRSRMRGLCFAGAVAFTVTAPVLWISRFAVIHYYVGSQVGEGALRNAEYGVNKDLFGFLMFYPKSLFTEHLGLAYVIACLVLLLAAMRGAVRWPPRLRHPEARRLAVFFVLASFFVPFGVLTVWPVKSPVVGNLLVLPCVANAILVCFGFAGFVRGRLGLRASLASIPLFAVLLALSVGFARELSAASQPVLTFGSASDFRNVAAFYDEIGARCEEYGWAQPVVVFDRLVDFLHPTLLSPVYFERHGALIQAQAPIGTTVASVSDSAALAAVNDADILALTDPDSPAPLGFPYPYSVSMQQKYPKLHEAAERSMVPVRQFHFFSQDVTLYVRPTLKVTGVSGGWITADGILLTGPSDLLRMHSVLEIDGRTILPEKLKPHVKATLDSFAGDRDLGSAVTEFAPGPQYHLKLRLTPSMIPPSGMAHFKLTFDSFFVPRDLGLNTDTRKLVLMEPQSIHLLPSGAN